MISIEAVIALLDKSAGMPHEWARVDENLSWRAFHARARKALVLMHQEQGVVPVQPVTIMARQTHELF